MLSIKRAAYEVMLDQLRAVYPQEGCGLLGGKDGRACRVYPVDNVLRSQSAYRLHPAQQIEAIFDMEAHGRELVAIYHSHPHGPARPSPTDVAQATYPQALYVIVSLADRARPVARAFAIRAGRVRERPLKVV